MKVQAPNVIAPGAGAGFNAPVRVQFVRHKWENYFILLVVAGVLVAVLVMETGRDSNPSMFSLLITRLSSYLISFFFK